MKLLDKLIINFRSEERNIEIYQGDLTDMTSNESVDVLIVSAFPNDYTPGSGTLIGALNKKGISVEKLSWKKAIDYRKMFSCWLSEEITSQHSGIQFNRILCFEPLYRGNPPQVVGDIFRSLAPILGSEFSITKVAMPLVACGDQMTPLSKMLPPLLDAAVHWMSLGIPLKNLKIVAYSEDEALQVKELFTQWKLEHELPITELDKERAFNYDIFISYSHENKKEVDFIVNELKKLQPELKLFIDRIELNPGASWQKRIWEALEKSIKAITLFSQPYLVSDSCQEEYNLIIIRQKDSKKEILIPIYLYSTHLPSYYKQFQYIDCREGDNPRLKQACIKIISMLKS